MGTEWIRIRVIETISAISSKIVSGGQSGTKNLFLAFGVRTVTLSNSLIDLFKPPFSKETVSS